MSECHSSFSDTPFYRAQHGRLLYCSRGIILSKNCSQNLCIDWVCVQTVYSFTDEMQRALSLSSISSLNKGCERQHTHTVFFIMITGSWNCRSNNIANIFVLLTLKALCISSVNEYPAPERGQTSSHLSWVKSFNWLRISVVICTHKCKQNKLVNIVEAYSPIDWHIIKAKCCVFSLDLCSSLMVFWLGFLTETAGVSDWRALWNLFL